VLFKGGVHRGPLCAARQLDEHVLPHRGTLPCGRGCVPADDGSAAAGVRGRASDARSVQAASVSQLLARMRSGKSSGVQPVSQDATGRRFPPPWTVIQHAESFAKLRSQSRGILLAQRFIALIVERLDNVPVHHRPDLALFRSLGRLLSERTPDVDFVPRNPPFVNRFTNLRPPDLIDFSMTPNRRLSAVRCQETEFRWC
jgi:hypothetical protein